MSEKYDDRPFHVVMFVSRNKDNHDIELFKQRTKAFLTQKNTDELSKDFEKFVNEGVNGEFSRFYISVNSRKHEAVVLSLQHYLLDHPDVNLAKIDKLISSLAMKKGTALTKKFLFDYDDDPVSVGVFLHDVKQALGNSEMVNLHETVSGYAIVTDHGFDTRSLLEKWKDVELKRDGMLYVTSKLKK